MTPELQGFRLHPAARAAWRRAADELLINAIFGDEGAGAAKARLIVGPSDAASKPVVLDIQLRAAETIASETIAA